MCSKGFSGQAGGPCAVCPANTYSLVPSTSCSSCPTGSTSPAGSHFLANCTCDADKSPASGYVRYLAGDGLTLHGNQDGDATSALFSFDQPNWMRVVVSHDGATAFVSDYGTNKIRKIDLASGEVGTVTDLANAMSPSGFALTPDGATMLVAMRGAHRIYSIDVSSGAYNLFAGNSFHQFGFSDGNGFFAGYAYEPTALFYHPVDVAITPDGATALVADSFNHLIRSIDMGSREVNTFAGFAYHNGFPHQQSSGYQDGPGTSARFNQPEAVRVSPDGSKAYVITSKHVRVIDMSTREVSTLAGGGGTGNTDAFGTNALFSYIQAMDLTRDGTMLVVTDMNNMVVRTVDTASGEVKTLAGSGTAGMADGIGTNAMFSGTWKLTGIGVTPDGKRAIVVDGGNMVIRTVSLAECQD